jgi:hypothetical protein
MTTALETLDRAYQQMMQAFVRRGQALHYTELARDLGLTPEAGRDVLLDLMSTGVPAWLYDGTDYVASFAPFNNVPTQYRISVEGQQRWFAQCGFEALAVCWLFPGKDVTIEAPCLDCGEALRVVVREGRIVSAEPATICAFVDIPFREWRPNLAYS